MTSPILDLQGWYADRRRVLVAFVATVALALAGPVFAQSLAPDALVKKVTEDVLSAVKADPDIKSGNMTKIQALVETKILPYVDFQKMTASAVGRNWSQATPEQQKEITEQFKQVLIRTYAGALSDVSDQKVEYLPYRASPTDTNVQVNTRVVNPKGGEPIQLQYRLDKTGNDWKIVNVNVVGVWLVDNYRSTFQSEVSRGGIEGLLKSLTARNQPGGAPKR